MDTSSGSTTGKKRDNRSDGERMATLLRRKLGAQVKVYLEEHGDANVIVDRAYMLDFFNLLKLDSEFAFNFLLDITAIDYSTFVERPTTSGRYEVIYHLLSLKHAHRLRVRVEVAEENAEVFSVAHFWSAANFLEREVWDMYGIKFSGHPDLRRILMYDEFVGHPLRKDYPLRGKQPRVQLLHPEVENTATHMSRPELVKINTSRERR